MKKLKNLMLMFILVPCMFLLGACGGSEDVDYEAMFDYRANVNVGGNYSQTVTLDDFATYLSNNQAKKMNMAEYHYTASLPMETDTYYVNGLVKTANTQRDYEMALRVSINEGQTSGEVGAYYQYRKGGVEYYNVNTTSNVETFKSNLKEDGSLEGTLPTGLDSLFIKVFSIGDLFEMMDISADSEISATNGLVQTTKVKIRTAQGSAEQIMFLVFEANELVGVRYVLTQGTSSAYIDMQKTNMNITFPEFDEKFEELEVK